MSRLSFRFRDSIAKAIGKALKPLPIAWVRPAFLKRARQRARTLSCNERLDREPPFYSQYGQDEFIWKHLLNGSRQRGIFCDIGAADGKTNSNTMFFEEELGWAGFCVDPNPVAFEELQHAREARCFNFGIGATASDLEFLRVDGQGAQLSCFADFTSPEHLSKIELLRHSVGSHIERICVPVIPFDQFAFENGIDRIDLLSVDAEGMEKSIVSSMNHERISIRIIAIEANGDPVELEYFMYELGYRLEAIVGTDHIYVNLRSEKV